MSSDVGRTQEIELKGIMERHCTRTQGGGRELSEDSGNVMRCPDTHEASVVTTFSIIYHETSAVPSSTERGTLHGFCRLYR